MKLLHIISSIGPARGGPSVVIRTMARCQARRSLEVDVATTDDNGKERPAIRERLPVREDGVNYWIFPRQTRFYQVSIPLTIWLRRHVSDYDLVHIHGLFCYSSVAAAICAKSAGVPYVVRPFGTLNQWGMQNRRRALKKLSFRVIESRILRSAARVHFTSEQEALEAQQLGVDHKNLVIANPVELPPAGIAPRSFRAFYPELRDRLIVLFLSRLDAKKGLDLLLPAFSNVLKGHPGTTLVIAGDGDAAFVARLKETARRLGIDSEVIWAGFLQGEEKIAALADADLFVLPSYSENFGVAVVEAMGAGLPVIVSDQVGIHRDISQAHAGSVTPCNAGDLANTLAMLIENREMRALMSANARELARQFSPEAVTEQMIAAYAAICNDRRKTIAA